MDILDLTKMIVKYKKQILKSFRHDKVELLF